MARQKPLMTEESRLFSGTPLHPRTIKGWVPLIPATKAAEAHVREWFNFSSEKMELDGPYAGELASRMILTRFAACYVTKSESEARVTENHLPPITVVNDLRYSFETGKRYTASSLRVNKERIANIEDLTVMGLLRSGAVTRSMTLLLGSAVMSYMHFGRDQIGAITGCYLTTAGIQAWLYIVGLRLEENS